MASDKSTVYVDIDDEITAIIDKVTGAGTTIVALVLPKRATALRSLVNLRLLKRAADDNKKQLVLITSESGVLPLAGAAGLHVARTLSSKPEIPASPEADETVESIDEDDEPAEEFDARKFEKRPLGEFADLSGAAGAGEAAKSANPAGDIDSDEVVEFDNSEKTPAPGAAKPPKAPKAKKDKKLKIPDFSRFRNWGLIVVLALIVLGVLIYFGLEVWPHATVKIYTNQTSIPLSFNADLDSNANMVLPADGILPAVAQTTEKNYSQTVPASGQKDIGTPASGSVTFTDGACSLYSPDPVPAQTGVSYHNLTYITQSEADFSCSRTNKGYYWQTDPVDIVAQATGTQYNTSISGAQVNGSSATASGSASGGTPSNVVRVVQQSDIDSAEQQLKSQSTNSIEATLKSELQQNNLTPLTQTFATIPSSPTASANPGDQANNVTVTENITYVMFGYKASDMQKLLSAKVGQQINPATQGILDNGLAQATIKLVGTPSASDARVSISTTVIVGPKLNAASIKKQIEGKKSGDIRSALERRQGVSKVQVDFSPFWVDSVPSNASKIKIEFVKQS